MSDEPGKVRVRILDTDGLELGTVSVPAKLVDRLRAHVNPHGTCIELLAAGQSEPMWVCGDQCPRGGQ